MRVSIVACLAALLAAPLSAQQWRWPEKAKNLKVLPATTTAKELQQTMLSFTGALGVRCNFCHVGEEGKDLSDYDFASDTKPEKESARIMLKMVKAINSQFLTTLPEYNQSLDVRCITCHHGSNIPVLLEDRLKRTYDRHGIDSTLRQYHALRDQFYGGFTYDFKEGALLRLAEKIAEDTTKTSDAVKVLKLNIELYPAFAFSYVRLAGMYERGGDVQGAIDALQQAVKLNPKDERIKGQLERLQGKR